MAESGLLYGENWTTRDVRKWPTLFYQLQQDISSLFKVPKYLYDAIIWACGGDVDE